MKNLIERELNLHPVKPRGKEPLLQAWPEKASSDPERIAAWSEQYPDCNFGVVASGDICILESDDEGQLRERLSKQIPRTYTVQARPGRPHFYFRQTDATRKAGNMDLPGIFEFKQRNKYVVAEGSIHPKGMRYNCVVDAPIAEMPDWLVADLVKLKEGSGIRMSAPLPTDGKKIGEGEGRHPMLMSQAGKLWDGVKTAEEMFDELNAINLQHCDPPKEAHKLMGMIEWAMKMPPNTSGPKVLVGKPKLDGAAEVCTGDDYVIGPAKNAKFEGWFNLGEVSLIGGSSGAGKTTWALQMLEAQAKREDFLGHESYGLPYIIIMQDRSQHSLRRTFRRLGMDMENLPLRTLPPDSEDRNPAVVLEDLYNAETVKPRIIFIEGLDIWIPDNFKMREVAKVLKPMQEVATRYNFAIISTIGSPKKSPKEQYASPRDAIFGSSVFARMTETIVKISEDYDTGARRVQVMPRQEAQEKFHMRFRDGRIVVGLQTDIKSVAGESKFEAFCHWLTPASTWEQARDRFGISRSTFFDWKKEAAKINSLHSPENTSDSSPAEECRTMEFIDG